MALANIIILTQRITAMETSNIFINWHLCDIKLAENDHNDYIDADTKNRIIDIRKSALENNLYIIKENTTKDHYDIYLFDYRV